jgi:hypothetical protein
MTHAELEQRYSRQVKIRWVNERKQRGTGEYTPDGVARVA